MSGSVTIVGLLAASAALQVFTGPAVSAGTRPPTSLPHGTTQLIRVVAPSYGATYAGANPEPMDQLPAYGLGAVIAYNTAGFPVWAALFSSTWARVVPPQAASRCRSTGCGKPSSGSAREMTPRSGCGSASEFFASA